MLTLTLIIANFKFTDHQSPKLNLYINLNLKLNLNLNLDLYLNLNWSILINFYYNFTNTKMLN